MESRGEHQGHSLILWFPSSGFAVYLQTIRKQRRGAGANREHGTVCSDHNITAERPHKEVDVPRLFVAIRCEMEALKMGEEAHKENGSYGGTRWVSGRVLQLAGAVQRCGCLDLRAAKPAFGPAVLVYAASKLSPPIITLAPDCCWYIQCRNVQQVKLQNIRWPLVTNCNLAVTFLLTYVVRGGQNEIIYSWRQTCFYFIDLDLEAKKFVAKQLSELCSSCSLCQDSCSCISHC